MNQEIKSRWVTALRSGQYRQGRLALRNTSDEYCCLGVLCEIAVQENVIPEPVRNMDLYRYGDADDSNSSYLPLSVQMWAGLTKNPVVTSGSDDVLLADLNDAWKSFEEIADLIEENL